jgi:peptidoglycan-associated lipoprotein
MKALLFTSSLVALLALSGCTGTTPAVDDSAATAADQAEEISVVDESSAAATESAIELGGDMTLEAIESRLSPIYFGFDQYKLVETDIEILRANAEIANASAEAQKYAIKLEGNCDEWGSDEYNFALGLKRANAVKDELINDGIASERITLVSYGSSNPVCTEKTQECWSKNRRVDFKLLP